MNGRGLYGDVPLGLGLALMQNTEALNNFVTLSEAQKKAVLERAGSFPGRQEIRSLVDDIGQGNFF